jgi:hypothetical protein
MLKAKRNDINDQGKEKKPVNEMNEINEQGNEHVDHSNTIRKFVNLFKPEIFPSRFTNIFNLIYFSLQIVKKNSSGMHHKKKTPH